MIEGKPNLASAYLSRRSYPCAEIRAQEVGVTLVRGMARVFMTQRLAAYLTVKPAGGSLDSHISAVENWDQALKPVSHDRKEYLLVEVPDDLAEAFDCSHRAGPRTHTTAKRNYGNYFATGVNLTSAEGKPVEALFVWSKEEGLWKIVSFQMLDRARGKGHFALQSSPGGMQARRSVKVPIIPVEGDPEFIRAATGQVSEWFVKRNYESALSYMTSEAYACIVRESEGGAKATTQAAQKRLLMNGMREAATAIGSHGSIESAVRAPEPMLPDLRVVTHPHSKEILLASIADQYTEWIDCSRHFNYAEVRKRIGTNRTYGQLYVSTFQLQTNGSAAVFYEIWKKVDGRWRVIYWETIEP